MKTTRSTFGFVMYAILLLAAAPPAFSQMLWTVGLNDNGWPAGTGGGANASFLQENGVVNALPGSPFALDNDYYLAGDFSTVIAGNGTYDPVGVVSADEESAERAITDGDIEQRYHFNLPATLTPADLLSVTYDIYNLDGSGADPRYGLEVYVNGKKVQNQIVFRTPQLLIDYTTPQFSLADVGAQAGPGFDNIVTLRGISYNSDGGGAWMGIDHVQMNRETEKIPTPVLPWQVGLADNAWAVGTGGGSNTTFVAGNGSVNALPGSPISTATAGGADNDYYFAGIYTNVIAGNGTYTPVGRVQNDETAAERGFAGADNELRYHFNLPNTLQSSDYIAVSFGALNLDTNVANPKYGVEVWVNGVRVQAEVVISPADLKKSIKTDRFTLASVNAGLGLGYDNVVTLRGISHKAEGGGDSLGLDFVALVPAPIIPAPIMPWAVGRDDNAQPTTGTGGGPNANFVQENGTVNPLPGNPNSPVADKQADNDYYLAGSYFTIIPANGNYTPVGDVPYNEEAAERAFAGEDNLLRYHFNLPSTLSPNTLLTVTYDALSLDDSAGDPRYGVEVYFNNVMVQTQMVIRADQLNKKINTPPFTVAQVNAQLGPGYDNIVSLKGINYNADGGGNWMGFDYIELNPVGPTPFPWSVGKDDNAWPAGFGGGANTTFVQEGMVNTLPGDPASPEVNQRADDDYYFAGIYTNTIPSVVAVEGDYTPVGQVMVNEESAARAFVSSDNILRYHFNLPSTLKPTDQVLISFDFNNLDTSGADPRYGFEVYFNSIKVQEEVIVANAQLDFDYVIPVTLSSVNAQTGPGWDNIVTLQGISHSADGGGAWMGVDYIQLDPIPQPVFPWAVGKADNGWPTGEGGGPNANFVQEKGASNELPGGAHDHPVNQQADSDYYLAGGYTNIIASNGSYVPVGYVPRNEEAAQRAFAGQNNDMRFHFNLPATLSLTNKVVVTYGVYNLDTSGADPRYGVQVYVNGVLVQDELVVRTNQLGVANSTQPFTLASVNAQTGVGPDNIVTLKGINYSADGGGNWMGIDYVQMTLPGEGVPLKFTGSTAKGGKITITWTGTGNLEWSTSLVGGAWTAVTPTPTSPYTEDILPNQATRFYRLKKP